MAHERSWAECLKLSEVTMSEYIQTYLALARQLDALTLVGLSVAVLLVFAVAREYYLRFATPPAYHVLPWYPIPDDLPTGPVEPYGAPAMKSRYMPNMRFGVNGSVGMHVTLILLALFAARLLTPKVVDIQVPDRPILRPELQPPPSLRESEPEAAPQSYEVMGPPPPISFRPIPVEDYLANPHATIHDMKDFDLGETSFNGGEYSIWGKRGGPDGRDNFGRGPYKEDENEVVSISIVEQLPEIVTIPAPDFPDVAKVQGIEGKVVLNVLVGKDGHVRDVKLVRSIPALDEAARSAALQAVFKPALWQNKPVAVWVTMPIRFSLRQE